MCGRGEWYLVAYGQNSQVIAFFIKVGLTPLLQSWNSTDYFEFFKWKFTLSVIWPQIGNRYTSELRASIGWRNVLNMIRTISRSVWLPTPGQDLMFSDKCFFCIWNDMTNCCLMCAKSTELYPGSFTSLSWVRCATQFICPLKRRRFQLLPKLGRHEEAIIIKTRSHCKWYILYIFSYAEWHHQCCFSKEELF